VLVELATLQAVSYIIGSLGVFVAAVYYVSTLRNNQRTQQLQLETRQAQLFMQIYNQSHNDPTFIDAINRILEIGKIETYDKWQEVNRDGENKKALSRVGMFYEGLGVLVKEGYVSIRLVALLMTGMTRNWWENIYKSHVSDTRVQMGFPRFVSESEYLYNELMNYINEHPELRT
jgi:hypothetical protein